MAGRLSLPVVGEQLPENGLDMEEDDLEEALEEAALDDDDEELP